MGLAPRHGYSIIGLFEVKAPDTESGSGDVIWHRVVRIRNPHGQLEWTGDWSDAVSLFSTHTFTFP